MSIPDRAEWGEIDKDDLDAKYAFKQFFGKSQAEAEQMFRRNALHYQEDLQSMPSAPFNFYAPVFARYINSESARGDSDGASSFLRLVAWTLKSNRDVMTEETEVLLVSTAEQVSMKQAYYDADEDIYGRFGDIYQEIKALAKHGT